jgi:hypothetical protein
MSNASTTQQMPGGTTQAGQAAVGHGKHRGPASAHDTETAPRGRHRKPAEQTEKAA